MVQHDKTVAHATWHYEILNDFIIQQFPAIVSWLLSFLYTLRQRNADVYADKGGQLSHDLRYVSAVVSHTFISFGELLQLQKRVLELSGYAQRLLDFDVALTSIQAYERTHGDANVVDSTEVAFADVDIVTPTGTCLASKVSFTVPQGSNLLVTGPNVSGKSSLFRVLGGLWPVRSGRLHRPLARPTDPAGSISTVFMVPQRPYNAIGSLAQQITYPVEPDLTDAATVATLDELMRMVRWTRAVPARLLLLSCSMLLVLPFPVFRTAAAACLPQCCMGYTHMRCRSSYHTCWSGRRRGGARPPTGPTC
eukprot:m.1473600 g.1473600  ORF g.1473600 m.1473600 type:complete len:308 (-) comp25152_c1_seq19:3591-4514(-)